jgi:2-oxoglutarate ferredoxin oxidoreductase subunit beta
MATATKENTNRIGFERDAYEGGKSTLCIGCGHDLITRYIIDAMWQNGVEPHKVAKMSGIGCSSKTPAYFLNHSWGFNGVHGRMPAIATGVNAANKYLLNVGVSGDGDTASIGMGQFVHMVRRNPQCIYLIENNGVYGLTKGQFSATADKGATLKTGAKNDFHAIDMCSLSIELGCGFVARAFAGNKKQMMEILRAAAVYPGLAMIDVISPCVTFNNFDFSKHGFVYMRGHEQAINEIGFVQSFENIEAEIEPGTAKDVQFPDGSMVRFRTLAENHDPTDRDSALKLLHTHYEKGEVLTGMFYLNPSATTLMDVANSVDKPMYELSDADLRPTADTLSKIMEIYS